MAGEVVSRSRDLYGDCNGEFVGTSLEGVEEDVEVGVFADFSDATPATGVDFVGGEGDEFDAGVDDEVGDFVAVFGESPNVREFLLAVPVLLV